MGNRYWLFRRLFKSGVVAITANVIEIDLVEYLKTKNYDNRKTVFRSTEDC